MKQHIWTPEAEHVLQFLIDKKNAGYRILSICPLYRPGMFPPLNYIVIGEETDASLAIERDRERRERKLRSE